MHFPLTHWETGPFTFSYPIPSSSRFYFSPSLISHPSSLIPHLPSLFFLSTPHRPDIAMLSVPYRHERQGAPSQGMNTPEQQHSLPPWKLWNSVAVLVRNVPNEVNTFILWQAFRDEGSIRSIDLYEDQSGNRQTKGKIWFRFVLSILLSLTH